MMEEYEEDIGGKPMSKFEAGMFWIVWGFVVAGDWVAGLFRKKHKDVKR